MAKILVVEDEPDLREAVVEELNDEGHITIEAENGLEGLERLSAETPDLVLSDITMPKMNGYQFYRTVKESHPEHALTPFIFLSALSDRDNELKGLRLGVDDYLTKPVDFDLMIARIDLALRRRQAMAGHQDRNSTAASKTPAKADQVEQTPSQGLEAIIHQRDGSVLTGKFETVSPDVLRTRIGDRWSEFSKLILKCAEATIRSFLEPEDVLHVTPSQDFLVCFSGLTEDQAHAKVEIIRDAIWETLFEQTHDEELSGVNAQTFELPLDPQGNGDQEAVLSEIDNLIDQQKTTVSESNQRRLLELHQHEELHALPLLSPKGSRSKIKTFSFEGPSSDLARKLLGNGSYESSFLVELLKTLFDQLKERKSLKEVFSEMGMLLPIRSQVIRDPDCRDRVIDLCRDLEQSLEAMLIVEITGTADRIQFELDALKPLPVGRQLQFLELRRMEQMNNLEPSELSARGVAFISMSFDHVLRHEAQRLSQFIKTLEDSGVKFFMKDIPEGKLPDAQIYHAHLYAMQQ